MVEKPLSFSPRINKNFSSFPFLSSSHSRRQKNLAYGEEDRDSLLLFLRLPLEKSGENSSRGMEISISQEKEEGEEEEGRGSSSSYSASSSPSEKGGGTLEREKGLEWRGGPSLPPSLCRWSPIPPAFPIHPASIGWAALAFLYRYIPKEEEEVEAGQPPSYCVVNCFQTCLLAVCWWGGGYPFPSRKEPKREVKKMSRGGNETPSVLYSTREGEGRECGDLESRSTLQEE